MKRFLTVWAALAVAAPAVAEELLIQGPNDSIIRMQVDACPDGRSCLMTSRISEGDVNIVVPEWAAPVNSEDWQDSIAERAYLRGLSDGYVFDFCAHCDCCTMSVSPSGEFMSFDAAPAWTSPATD